MNVLVAYYSLYGHNLKMARAAGDGVQSVSGVEVTFRRVAECTVKLCGMLATALDDRYDADEHPGIVVLRMGRRCMWTSPQSN